GPLIGWFSVFGRIKPVSCGINERWGDEYQDRLVGSFLRPAEQKSLAVEHGRLRAGGEPLERRLRRIRGCAVSQLRYACLNSEADGDSVRENRGQDIQTRAKHIFLTFNLALLG